MAQIIRITSEALQATIRRLLPSQQGFGEDLQASNVITPIIDLTPTAEGSALPIELQQAITFGGTTNVIAGTSQDIITTSGFFRCRGYAGIQGNVSTSSTIQLNVEDGSTSKPIYLVSKNSTTSFNEFWVEPLDFIVFLRSQDKLSCTITTQGYLQVGYIQVADLNGNLNDPSGFESQ